jgi:DNA-directed RNA polymerase subunit RPC12/RpoP
MGFLDKLIYRKEILDLAARTPTATIDGVTFTITAKDPEFWAGVSADKPSALLLDIRDAGRAGPAAVDHFGLSAFRRLLKFGQALCFPCTHAYSELQEHALLFGTAKYRNSGFEVSAPSQCPRCGSKYILWAYDLPPRPTEADIPAIREIYRDLARNFWSRCEDPDVTCKRCGKATIRFNDHSLIAPARRAIRRQTP